MKFRLTSKFKPSGDQPQAIEELVSGLDSGSNAQVLLGVTGSGKTFTIANVLAKVNRPALIISPNKILAAQLYGEFKQFFPENAVEFFISYYDYYQPEAYVPQSDTYIDKDASINDHIDRLRLKATSSCLERNDVIVVASVSCIYGLGSPEEYKRQCMQISTGKQISRRELLTELIRIHYQRNDIDLKRGCFRVRGSRIDISTAYLETVLRVELENDAVVSLAEIDPLTSKTLHAKDQAFIYPARHFVTTRPQIEEAVEKIREELKQRLEFLTDKGKLLEAQRLEQRTRFDMEMLLETGFCHGIENYSRHLSGRNEGERPGCLLDYFPDNFIVIVDESHITVPQIRGMYEGDRSRKQTLVDYGFRLPSALDNRPLRFNEWEDLTKQVMYVSATPGPYELKKTEGSVIEQIIRPTGLVDPEVIIRPITGQIEDLMKEIDICIKRKERVLVTTLTKRMSEDLTKYLQEKKYRVKYLHSDIDALKRVELIKELRKGEFDVLVGINLLREGLDLPEVSLVAVLDADKEGFLRSETSLIQVCGRAARNIEGKVLMYADVHTGSIRNALKEMNRRRKKQEEYNTLNNITPKSIIKEIQEFAEFQYQARTDAYSMVAEERLQFTKTKDIPKLLLELSDEMKKAADRLDFEMAAVIRDQIKEIKSLKLKSPFLA
ncbi:MAG: excinuclease ABC subunit UvrB [bacterium]